MGHTNDRSTKASSLVKPTSLNLQPRPFAPLESDEKEETVSRKSGYSENFLEKIINTPKPELATTVQRKSGNPLKAIAAERNNAALQNQSIQRQESIEEEKSEEEQEDTKEFTMNPEPPPVQRKSENRLRAKAAERMAIQAKLAIGEPNDKYEQEADATAARVVQQINSSTNASTTSQNQPIQRQEMEEDEELQMKPLVQRRENLGGGEASTDLESSIQSARGGGQSLDANLQQAMGQAMGADFSGVKVHTDSQSDQLNKSIQAKAFTTGQDVFFRQGAYEPSSRGGQELIAHELTHVVQQNGGAVQRSLQSKKLLQQYSTSYISSNGQSTIQREISSDQFVEDTTSSFLCISWRKGDEGERAEMERLIEAFEAAGEVLSKVKMLDNLTGKARQLNAGDRSTKFKAACQKIVTEGQELRDKITETDEYKRAFAEDESAKKKQAELEEKQRLEGLQDLNLEARIAAFTKRYGGALIDTLLAGTADLAPDAKVLKLAQNFKNIGFTYTMKNSNFTALLGGTVRGDCSTLSYAMAAICREIFLIEARVPNHRDLLVTSSEKTIDEAKSPTAEGGAFWIFDNHYWVEANGKQYDPLFGRAFSNEGWHALQGKKVFKDMGITMENYGGEYRMVLLYGVGNKRISQVTSEEWETHKKGVSIEVTASFEEMKEQVLSA